MKKLTVFFICLCSCFFLQGQVMHSPNNLEISFGKEGFDTFSPQRSELLFFDRFSQVSGQKPPEGPLRWRSILSANYRKIQSSGNYFGFSASYGKRTWLEEGLESFDAILGVPTGDTFAEERNDRTINLGYTYSFLLTKESPNLQFFLGGHSSIYDDLAKNIPLDFDTNSFFGSSQRNIFGVRISAVPELMYLFPNSNITASFRAKLPLIHFERSVQNTSVSFISSFVGGFSVHNYFELAKINHTRFEIGIGYFLAAR